MAVAVTGRPSTLPLPSSDLRYPVAAHAGYVSSNGDVSGGDNAITYQWSSGPADLLFSIEVISIILGRVAATPCLVVINTQQIISGTTTLRINDLLPLPVSDAAMGNTGITRNYGQFIWQPTSSTAWTAKVSVPNLADAFEAFFYGYVWDIRALKLFGGPIKPGTFPTVF